MFVTKFFFSPTHYCFKMFGFKLGVLGEKRRQWQCWDWCKPHPAQVNTLLIIIITLLLTFVVVSSLSYSCLPSLWSIITFFLAILFSVTILIFILKTETCLFSTFDLPCVLSCSATSQQTQGYCHHSYIIKARVLVVQTLQIILDFDPLSNELHPDLHLYPGREEQAKHAWNNRDRSLNIFVKEDCVFTFHRWGNHSPFFCITSQKWC